MFEALDLNGFQTTNTCDFGSKMFAALRPLFNNNMLQTQTEFRLPDDLMVLTRNSDIYIEINENIHIEMSKQMLFVESMRCACKLSQGCDQSCLNRASRLECSAGDCPSGHNCKNQTIQKGSSVQIERFDTKEKGVGVKSADFITKGDFITEYVGEVIPLEEFKERLNTVYKGRKHFHCIGLEKGFVIDSGQMGNLSRYINHSCNPNCEIQKWVVNSLPRLAVIAHTDIQPGEELGFDYNFSSFNASEPICYCKSKNCRKVLSKKK